MPDPDSYALRIKELPDVMRVHALDLKSNGCNTVPSLCRPEDTDAGDRAEFQQMPGEYRLMLPDSIHTDIHHPLRSLPRGNSLCDRLGTGFEPCRGDPCIAPACSSTPAPP